MLKKLVDKFKGMIHKLFALKDTPHAIAGGIAIGIFLGFTPLFGLKTLLSLGLAYLLRCNPLAAVIAVSLHDVAIPLWPVLLRIEYDIGYWVLSHPHILPPKFSGRHLVENIMNWKTFFLNGPTALLGSLFLATPTAVFSYFLSLGIVKRTQERHAKAEAEKEN